jgi:hypothetical protein
MTIPAEDTSDWFPTSDLDNSTVIHGYPGDRVVLERADGTLLGPLPHLIKHSPTGFAWGYGGSGPAELSRCVLAAVLGPRAACSVCGGRGRLAPEEDGEDWREVAFDPARHDADAAVACWNCEQGIDLPGTLYQQYKQTVVAAWPGGQEFRVTVAEVRAWLDEHRQNEHGG